MLINLPDGRSVNPAMVESCTIDNRFYMNGSATYLIIKMQSGERMSIENGYGVDVHKIKQQLEEA